MIYLEQVEQLVTIKDVINDRAELQMLKKQQQQEDIQKRLDEFDARKKKEQGQTLFDVQTSGNFESLPLFSAGDVLDTNQDEDPFLSGFLN